ncbi:hypothetical protein [Corallococcus carmarthensis]|uniref:Uncharacterized protein n=1 Tax=Corallococcus carmarthensis TaxID=2316728 RepID=A0A3A8KCW7_9BACT|nr:hypothetical protein [Corallococcus carmarthensis]NOK17468.1 hypothetical protein [Corallococcus carmarthensis]RKH02195.1 hypothetical protein D7X32_17780 [Corallococcus carmarthensis]
MGLGLAALLFVSGCSRAPAPPSPEFEQASHRWTALYAQKLDGAYLDPSIGEIEAQLQRVPADSVDAAASQSLLQRIQEGRTRMQAAQEEKRRAVANARTLPTQDPSQTNYPRPPERQAAEPVDAGLGDAGVIAGPQTGTPASELVAGFRGCFTRSVPITVEGRGMRDTWQLSDRASCQLEFPTHRDTALLIEDGRVLALLPKSAVRNVRRYEDGGVVPDGVGR